MSKHTLVRRLAEKKTSYTQILERVRRDIALYSLLDTPDSVEHIAERLGFKEVGSFSRAFKLWMGVTPSEYRQLDKKTKS
jgi:AraC-like DNA-binding protein